MAHPLSHSEDASDGAFVYNTLTNQTMASEKFSEATIGPAVIGCTAQIALWGMVLAWSCDYLRSELFERDPLRRKVIFLTAVSLCTVQTGFNFWLTFNWATHQARDADTMLEPSVIGALQPLTSGLLGAIVQAFLVNRAIGLLNARWSKRLAVVFFAVCIFLELFFSVFNVVLNLLFHEHKLHGPLLELVLYSALSGIWLWFAAITDIGVTVLLCVVLRKRIAGFNESTDKMLRALCWLAVQSASYTAVLALAGAITGYATPSRILYSSIPYAFWYLLPSCYVLALITTLCSRLVVGRPSVDGGNVTGGLPTISAQAGLGSMGGVPYGGVEVEERRPAFRRLPSAGRSGEKDRFGGVGGGVHVAEEVSIHISDSEPDLLATPPSRRAGLYPPVPTQGRATSQTEKEEIGAGGEKSVDDHSERKSSWGSSTGV